MGDTRSAIHAAEDLCVPNVTLHSRGRKQDVSLRLTQHHLILSYCPGNTSPVPRADHERHPDTQLQSNGDSARQSLSLDLGRHQRPSGSRDVRTAKARPKEIWIPYPMINYCTLRPGHSHSSQDLRTTFIPQLPSSAVDQSTFPPVYGIPLLAGHAAPSDPSTPHASTQATASAAVNGGSPTLHSSRAPAIRLRRRDFQMMALHFHSGSTSHRPDDVAREVFLRLKSRCCVDDLPSMHAFHFNPPQPEIAADTWQFDLRREFERMGIGSGDADSPGSSWRMSEINRGYSYSPTYPEVICVPQTVSDNTLRYGASFRSKARVPALTYLHSNGGSITRASQPLVGIQSKRNPQDERLVTAIFSSHVSSHVALPNESFEPSLANSPNAGDDACRRSAEVSTFPEGNESIAFPVEDEIVPQAKVYGSTRRNMIVDARPRVNALANRATGGGIEDVTNYSGMYGSKVERVFLNIPNIHVMRKSLDKVIESFANSDYLDLKPNQELLKSSGWLSHIANLLDGAEMVARVVGLGGSHVLLHCSDGWDRTSQVAALAEIMLDPYYRTLQGFITLVQKDFLSFGHKFNHRLGIQGSEKWFDIENERVAPSHGKDGSSSEATSLNRALHGAKNWFEKNRQSLFSQQNDGKATLGDLQARPPSPAANPVLHAPATVNTKDDRELRTDTKEIAPIFHQFLDAVFQLQLQHPESFEFNERFLRRLFYQAHAGQYGEFLFNNEKARSEHRAKFYSVWPHFFSRKEEFINPTYAVQSENSLLLPNRQSRARKSEMKWWSALFGRQDEDMNSFEALAAAEEDTGSDVATKRLNGTITASEDMPAAVPSRRVDGDGAGSDLRSQTNSLHVTTDQSNRTDLLDIAAFAKDSAYSER